MLQSDVSGRERLVQFFDCHACAGKQGLPGHKTQALEAANSQASLLFTFYAVGGLADSEAGKGLLRCLSVGFLASSEQAKAVHSAQGSKLGLVGFGCLKKQLIREPDFIHSFRSVLG